MMSENSAPDQVQQRPQESKPGEPNVEPARSSVGGTLLIPGGFVLALLGGAAAFGLTTLLPLDGFPQKVIGGVLVCLLAWPGVAVAHTGRRLRAQSADKAIAADSRPPILYLRPFQIDYSADSSSNPANPRYMSYFMPLAGLIDLVRALSGRDDPTFEEAFAEFCTGRNGPVVALGKPGERLPRTGAARQYVTDEDWKATVADYLARSQFAVIRFDATESLRWETQLAFSRLPRHRILLIFRSVFTADTDAYKAFRKFAKSLPSDPGVPPKLEEAQFLCWDVEGNAELLPIKYRSMMSYSRHAIDFEQTLAPFLERLKKE